MGFLAAASRPEAERRRLARVAALVALGVTAISFAAILLRLAAPTHPVVKAGWRLLLAAVALAPFVVRGAVRGSFDARQARAAVLGGGLYALHFGTWIASLDWTSIASSVTLVTSTPLLLGLVGTLRGRDAPGPAMWVALALAAVGVVVIAGGDLRLGSPRALAGDGLALAGAAAMAAYLLLARRVGERLEVLAYGGVAAGVGGLLLLVVAAASGLGPWPDSAASLGWLLLAALIPQLVGHTALTRLLRETTPTVVGVATLGEPVGATLLGWWILGETVSPPVLAGCAVTLAGVALAVRATSAEAG